MTAHCKGTGGCKVPDRDCATPWQCGLYQSNGGHRVEDGDDLPIVFLGEEPEDESNTPDIAAWLAVVAICAFLYAVWAGWLDGVLGLAR